MYENIVSIKTKNQNYLKSKIKTFRDNYKESLDRMNSRSSLHNLAGTTYSSKITKQFSPTKHPKKVKSSSSMINLPNPQKNNTISMKGLTMRVSHVPNLSDINTELLVQKRNLEEKIKFLKDQIAKENRLYNKADEKSQRNNQQKQKAENAFEELSRKSLKLNEAISDTKNDCNQLRININHLLASNKEKTNQINKQQSNVDSLENKTRLLKNNLIIEEKNRNFIKMELIKEQRIMNSASIVAKQLENERAMLLLEINKSVVLNKL